MNMIKFGFSLDGLKRLGIHYSYIELVELEAKGQFPKQIEPKTWDAEKVLEWLLVNIDKLPPKPTNQ